MKNENREVGNNKCIRWIMRETLWSVSWQNVQYLVMQVNHLNFLCTLYSHQIQSCWHTNYSSVFLTYCPAPISLTLILLMWRIWWAPNNASRWHMGFNSAFKGLNNRLAWSLLQHCISTHSTYLWANLIHRSLQWILRNQTAVTPTFQDQTMAIQSNRNQWHYTMTKTLIYIFHAHRDNDHKPSLAKVDSTVATPHTANWYFLSPPVCDNSLTYIISSNVFYKGRWFDPSCCHWYFSLT
jgi:hypothetical protein